MLVIFYSSLISYMLFFSICIAPLVNIVLDNENSSKLLRKIFPRNFLFGIIISLSLVILSIFYSSKLNIIFSTIILFTFLLNLLYVMPAINKAADDAKIKRTSSEKFKKLHLFSVVLYLIGFLLAVAGLLNLMIM